MSCKVYPGNCRDVLKALQMESIDFATTFPLYWNLRDHRTEPLIWAMGVADQKKEKRTGITFAISVLNHCRLQGILRML